MVQQQKFFEELSSMGEVLLSSASRKKIQLDIDMCREK